MKTHAASVGISLNLYSDTPPLSYNRTKVTHSRDSDSDVKPSVSGHNGELSEELKNKFIQNYHVVRKEANSQPPEMRLTEAQIDKLVRQTLGKMGLEESLQFSDEAEAAARNIAASLESTMAKTKRYGEVLTRLTPELWQQIEKQYQQALQKDPLVIQYDLINQEAVVHRFVSELAFKEYSKGRAFSPELMKEIVSAIVRLETPYGGRLYPEETPALKQTLEFERVWSQMTEQVEYALNGPSFENLQGDIITGGTNYDAIRQFISEAEKLDVNKAKPYSLELKQKLEEKIMYLKEDQSWDSDSDVKPSVSGHNGQLSEELKNKFIQNYYVARKEANSQPPEMRLTEAQIDKLVRQTLGKMGLEESLQFSDEAEAAARNIAASLESTMAKTKRYGEVLTRLTPELWQQIEKQYQQALQKDPLVIQYDMINQEAAVHRFVSELAFKEYSKGRAFSPELMKEIVSAILRLETPYGGRLYAEETPALKQTLEFERVWSQMAEQVEYALNGLSFENLQGDIITGGTNYDAIRQFISEAEKLDVNKAKPYSLELKQKLEEKIMYLKEDQSWDSDSDVKPSVSGHNGELSEELKNKFIQNYYVVRKEANSQPPEMRLTEAQIDKLVRQTLGKMGLEESLQFSDEAEAAARNIAASLESTMAKTKRYGEVLTRLTPELWQQIEKQYQQALQKDPLVIQYDMINQEAVVHRFVSELAFKEYSKGRAFSPELMKEIVSAILRLETPYGGRLYAEETPALKQTLEFERVWSQMAEQVEYALNGPSFENLQGDIITGGTNYDAIRQFISEAEKLDVNKAKPYSLELKQKLEEKIVDLKEEPY